MSVLMNFLSELIWAYIKLFSRASEDVVVLVSGKKSEQTYEDQIDLLMAQLSEASSQVDRVLLEMQTAAKQREADISMLEQKFKELLSRKENLEPLVADLEQKRLSNETLREFRGIIDETLSTTISKTERSSNRQNFVYFVAGLLLSVPIGILVNVVS